MLSEFTHINLVKIFFVQIILFVPIVAQVSGMKFTCQLNTVSQQSVAMTTKEREMVEKSASAFVKRFDETLDVNPLMDEWFVSDFLQHARKTDFFKGIIAHDVIKRISEDDLRRTYVSFLNYYYTKLLYEWAIGCQDIPNSFERICEPEIVTELIKRSKYEPLLSDSGNENSRDEKADEIRTKPDLKAYLSDLNKITAIYKKSLPRNVFSSPKYRESYKRTIEYQAPEFGARCGLPPFAENTVKVFNVDKDIFTLFFIENKGRMKVLFFGFN